MRSGTPYCMVSAQPLMAVSGVRSSCDTRDMKSFFSFSLASSSDAMSLMLSHRSPISSLYILSIFAVKSPCAMRFEVSLIALTGLTIERMK